MSLGICPGVSSKFGRLVGSFKSRYLGAKLKLRSVAFQPCMARGGVYVVKIGEIKVFVQKLCLKQGFFEDTNLDHLTSGWPGAHCFSGDANFDMFPKKYG